MLALRHSPTRQTMLDVVLVAVGNCICIFIRLGSSYTCHVVCVCVNDLWRILGNVNPCATVLGRVWRNVPARFFPCDIGAVLAFHPKNNPQASTKHLHQCHGKRDNARVLNVGVQKDKQNPRHAKDRINDHSTFVPPCRLESENVTEVARCLPLD